VDVDEVLAQCRARRSFEYLNPSKLDELQTKLQECLDWGEQKIKIAGQTYEVVDKHIRRLDQDLRKFEAELERERQQQAQQTQQVLKAQGKQKTPARVNSRKTRQDFQPVTHGDYGDDDDAIMVDDQLPMNHVSKQKRKPLIDAGELEQGDYMAQEHLSELVPVHTLTEKQVGNFEMNERTNTDEQAKGASVNITHSSPHTAGDGPSASSSFGHMLDIPEMPIDPNEPVYCTCKRVSFGQMIGCDNPDCPVEWFHFECVGLSESVKGKWFCPICQGKSIVS